MSVAAPAAPPVVHETNLSGLKLLGRGKVRDIYDLDQELLIVTTDRISAFDVVLPTAIPLKGRVLTALSVFWFDFLRDITPNHLITTDIDRMPEAVRVHRTVLAGRTMLVRKAKVFPVECVVRGYLAGSGWKDYQKTGSVCGVRLPAGLREADLLPQAVFTPATKEDQGKHDENITYEQMCAKVGGLFGRELQRRALAIYEMAGRYSRGRGVILADTKFEFGTHNGEILLVDEVLTPDSSRYWPVDRYQPGSSPPSYDKQYVRDWLESIQFNKRPPGPELPADVVARTSEKYVEAYRKLTGKELSAA